MPGLGKRVGQVPHMVAVLGSEVSKADLLEAACDLASLQNPTSCDDDAETFASLLEAINVRRAGRGVKPLKIQVRP